MPDLDTDIHVKMLENGRRKRTLPGRLKWALFVLFHYGRESNLPKASLRVRVGKAVRVMLGRMETYGLEWGDPEVDPSLGEFKARFLDPFVHEEAVIVEIGPGGGRWTRYLLHGKRVYGVDYYPELLAELTKNIESSKLIPMENGGCDLPGVSDRSVDFVFSFGTFVHLDFHLIEAYIQEIARVLRDDDSVAVVHYSDSTKLKSVRNEGFSDNDPAKMRQCIQDAGLVVIEEELDLFNHSSVVAFSRSS